VANRLLDHTFALAFRGLVYAQIWEDPEVDIEALQIRPDSRMVAIASGGCNVLSYLVADPQAITAVDLNTAHIALNRLKLASARHLPSHALFRRFFADADSRANIAAYREWVAPHLDDVSRRYWEGRDLTGRRRIGGFSKGIYKRGLLGNFIGVAHLLAKLYRIDLSEILAAPTLEEQRRVFEEKLAPVFDRRFVRWLTDQPASLFGLGIPPRSSMRWPATNRWRPLRQRRKAGLRLRHQRQLFRLAGLFARVRQGAGMSVATLPAGSELATPCASAPNG
jgi:S-adenosylmethionine-diacylglycerol 3-amino-3-carboxypropyl transferase